MLPLGLQQDETHENTVGISILSPSPSTKQVAQECNPSGNGEPSRRLVRQWVIGMKYKIDVILSDNKTHARPTIFS